MREILASILHSFGAQAIRVAESALDATEILANFHANCAIVDWIMRPVSGIEYVKHLRASTIDRLRNLPIIMLTGQTDMESIARAKEAGVNSFLGKPFTPNALYDHIVCVLERPGDFIANVSCTKSAEILGGSAKATDRPTTRQQKRSRSAAI
jgi:two-component system chemotaxis response regulator CheY